MNTIKGAIICNDTLRAEGLSHILASDFGIDTTICDHQAEIPEANLYFITPDALVRLHRYFMPKMRCTVVLTDETVNSPVITLDTTATLSHIKKALGMIISSLPRHDTNEHEPLSERETEVLRLVASGCINKEIASQLGISLNTVLSHRKNIVSKLGIKSTPGLTVYAMMNGLLTHHHHTPLSNS